MEPVFSLFDHLTRAARDRPASSALLAGDQRWTFAELHAEVLATSAALPDSPVGTPLVYTGNSRDLALAAYASSARRRALLPCAPEKSAAAIATCPADTALIISTSGSEGQPRQVLLGARQLDSAARAANACLQLGAGDCWLNCLPLYHIGGQSILWRAARAAACVVLHDGFVAEAVARDLDAHSITHLSLVPAMLSRLLDLGCRRPPALRTVLIGGAALSRPLYDRATAAGWPLFISYGMSETAAQVATFTPDDGAWHEGLVGRALPGHAIRIGDDGRIRIRGPQVMLGYLDGSGVDAEGWLTTGDLGDIDADGRLTVLGRADDMLISGGRNIHPQEIESCLAACPGVVDVAVTGLPDPVWGDLVVALVVGSIDPAHLLDHARHHLPSAALPRRIRQLDRLPRNAAGKLERAALKRLAA